MDKEKNKEEVKIEIIYKIPKKQLAKHLDNIGDDIDLMNIVKKKMGEKLREFFELDHYL